MNVMQETAEEVRVTGQASPSSLITQEIRNFIPSKL